MAAAAVKALLVRAIDGRGTRIRCSLARTGRLFVDDAQVSVDDSDIDLADSPLSDEIEMTSWGPVRRVEVPLQVPGTPMRWTSPAMALGTSPPQW